MKLPERIESTSIKSLFDSTKVKGAVLIYRQGKNIVYSNDFDWAETGFLPASTFKIANSIQALENGIVEDDSTMFYWDGQPRYLKSWEEDLTFHQAFQRSCVPCYQQIARETGVERMRQTLEKIGYPGMVFDSSTIDNFWLEGDSRISQFQQIEFLKRLVNKDLPVSQKTVDIMSKIMLIDQNEDYDFYGKTGWAQPNDSTNIGWFVGYAVTPKDTLYMATNIQPTPAFNMNDFGKIRMLVTIKALEGLYK
jgi:beta-lactamase class D